MKAIIYDKYGSPDVLELRDVDTPMVKDTEVLVRVRAASVNPYDWHMMRGEPRLMRMQSGWRKPKASGLGADVAGQVETVGKGVGRFRPGDEVFGMRIGSCAEYVAVSEDSLMLKPSILTMEQAAAASLAGLTALQGLRTHGRIQSGQRVLIIGAAGGVGTFAVQLARLFGATVTGVCSTRNMELIRSLGADDVIDYTQEDFTQGGRRYDLIFQVAGTDSGSACRRALTTKGTLVLCSGSGGGRWLGPMGRIIRALLMSPFVSQRVVMYITSMNRDDLQLLCEFLEAGNITPVIDRTYPLSETPEAIRYLEEGHARGKVVITV